MYRKRAGLSQAELARLLGCRSGAKVSRYERFAREPTLKTALACEAIFQVPVQELFRGVYDDAEREALKQARFLARRLRIQTQSPIVATKLTHLRRLAEQPIDELEIIPLEDL